jgi:hypothetical protein
MQEDQPVIQGQSRHQALVIAIVMTSESMPGERP